MGAQDKVMGVQEGRGRHKWGKTRTWRPPQDSCILGGKARCGGWREAVCLSR